MRPKSMGIAIDPYGVFIDGSLAAKWSENCLIDVYRIDGQVEWRQVRLEPAEVDKISSATVGIGLPQEILESLSESSLGFDKKR